LLFIKIPSSIKKGLENNEDREKVTKTLEARDCFQTRISFFVTNKNETSSVWEWEDSALPVEGVFISDFHYFTRKRRKTKAVV
jgi:hypothetical protein